MTDGVVLCGSKSLWARGWSEEDSLLSWGAASTFMKIIIIICMLCRWRTVTKGPLYSHNKNKN